MFSKSLIQFSVDGWSCVPSMLLDLRPNHGGANEDSGDLLQKVPCTHCCTQCLRPKPGHRLPMPPPETPGHSWASLGQFLVGSLLLSPGSWYIEGFICALQVSVSPLLCNFWWFYCGVNDNLLQGGLCHTQVICTQRPCSRPLLTCTSTGDTLTEFWLSLCRENH